MRIISSKATGVAWFRKFLGQDESAPVRHPMVYSGFGTRCLGISVPEPPGSTAAILIPSVGCPMGCNFCSTSAMFGGKGRSVNFYETGRELFDVMCRIESELKVDSFFVMDENFLLQRSRALALLELMEKHGKSWSLYVFSSARVLRSYTMEQLVGLGISWVWMGLEGEDSRYAKLKGVDARALVQELKANGIRVLGSSIIGLEHHTPENIDRIIDYAIAYDTDFHQFMLYTPVAGTPLYEQHRREGNLLPESEFTAADSHGQYRFNYRHAHIPAGREEQFLINAFDRDFKVNGPSLARLIRTTLAGWQRYKNHPDRRIRKRYAYEKRNLKTIYAASVWAMRKYYRNNPYLWQKMDGVLESICREFGWKTRLFAALFGRVVFVTVRREEKRLARGWRYEPSSFYEKNQAACRLEGLAHDAAGTDSALLRWVPARLAPYLPTVLAMLFNIRLK